MLSLETLKALASEVGIDDIGIAVARRLDDEAAFMDDWIDHGWHGNMSYLERNRNLRYDPRQLVPNAQTVIVCFLTYAHSGHDYHRAVKSKLYELEALLIEKGYCTALGTQNKFCDSAPFLERRWAVEAGLGWIGNNHQLIHPSLGSYVHIGELVITEPVEAPSITPIKSLCGTCTRCIEACPGLALGQKEWDARKCKAYITHKCVICQQVCPFNEHIKSL